MDTTTITVGTDTLTITVPAGWQRDKANGSRRQAAMRKHIMDEVVPFLGLWTNGTMVEAVCGCIVAVDRSHTVEVEGIPAPVAVAAFECDRAIAPGAPYAPGTIVPVCPSHNGSPKARAATIGRIRAAAERVARHFGE